MKNLIILSIMSFVSFSASASSLKCGLTRINNGVVEKQSKVIEVKGNVEVEIKDLEKSDKIIGKVSGNTDEANGLGLYIYHTEKDVMAVAGSVDSSTTVQLYLDGSRYALSCWK